MNKDALPSSDLSGSDLSRRDMLSAAAAGALVIGFRVPRAKAQIIDPEGAAWANEPEFDEVNAWVVVAPDNSVTIRIAQTEIGQGVWTSNAMMVAEELQCDWSKVRPEYASINRDAREMAPEWTLNVMGDGAQDPNGGGEPEFRDRNPTGTNGIPDSLYRRMRTNAAASVRDGRYYLQLAGAEARERLLLAAARVWRVPRRRGEFGQQPDQPWAHWAQHYLWTGCIDCRANTPSESRRHPHQAAFGMDIDGDRAEKTSMFRSKSPARPFTASMLTCRA